MKKFLLLPAVALLVISCSSQYATRLALQGGLRAVQAMTLTDEQMQAYIAQYIADLDTKSNVLPESNNYVKRLSKITAGLTAVDGIPLNFKVYQTKEVNAFACADGSVRVYTGLLDLMTDAEVLGVIGHEIGHVALKHTRKQYQQALLASAARYGLASAGGVVGTLSASQLGAIGEAIAGAQFSQKQESDADDYGYEFLKNAGKNPWALAMAFEKLQQLGSTSSSGGNSAAGASSAGQIFSSHPTTEKRIQRVSKRAEEDGFQRP